MSFPHELNKESLIITITNYEYGRMGSLGRVKLYTNVFEDYISKASVKEHYPTKRGLGRTHP